MTLPSLPLPPSSSARRASLVFASFPSVPISVPQYPEATLAPPFAHSGASTPTGATTPKPLKASESAVFAPSTLQDWAPSAGRPTHQAKYVHLPLQPQSGAWTGQTSFPNTQVKPSDLEHSLVRLLSPALFESFVTAENGRGSFKKYLTTTPRGSSTLDLWWDLKVLQGLGEKVRLSAGGIRDVYLQPEGENHVDMAPRLLEDTVLALRTMAGVPSRIATPAATLLNSLYANEFQSYIKHRLVEHAQVRLGGTELFSDAAGLGESFVLTNPRLQDSPIVLVSPAFCALTGYSADQIVGRNCRFLQGNATAPASVRSVRDAVRSGNGITQLLLNYKLDGTPFWNLLCVIPLRDERGDVTYFIGGQTNVSGTISNQSSSSTLAFLLTDTPATSTSSSNDLSPEVQSHALRRSAHEIADVDDSPVVKSRPAPPPAPASIHLSFDARSAKSGGKGKKLFGSLFGGGGSKRKSEKKEPASQLLGGAEQGFVEPAPLQERITEFATTYERVLMFRRTGREVLFATPEFLYCCGLQPMSRAQLDASPILHMDLLDLIEGKTSAEGRQARAALKAAIDGTKKVSVACRIRLRENKMFGVGFKRNKESSVFGVLHITPLTEASGDCAAFVAIFGPEPVKSSK
ncbi:hypothetical protein RQP46_009743 [Phenoliferia psychrophenolica]